MPSISALLCFVATFAFDAKVDNRFNISGFGRLLRKHVKRPIFVSKAKSLVWHFAGGPTLTGLDFADRNTGQIVSESTRPVSTRTCQFVPYIGTGLCQCLGQRIIYYQQRWCIWVLVALLKMLNAQATSECC